MGIFGSADPVWVAVGALLVVHIAMLGFILSQVFVVGSKSVPPRERKNVIGKQD
ncbi:hypothetical protein DIPPA_05314 [Diplonema papillatum]|nr:hypothetical protein DIPPA_05314 [Diplonema papillatum]